MKEEPLSSWNLSSEKCKKVANAYVPAGWPGSCCALLFTCLVVLRPMARSRLALLSGMGHEVTRHWEQSPVAANERRERPSWWSLSGKLVGGRINFLLIRPLIREIFLRLIFLIIHFEGGLVVLSVLLSTMELFLRSVIRNHPSSWAVS